MTRAGPPMHNIDPLWGLLGTIFILRGGGRFIRSKQFEIEA